NPVCRLRLRRGGREEAGIAAQSQLDELIGKRASDLVRVAVFHGHAKLGHRLGVAGCVGAIGAEELNIDVVESSLPAQRFEKLATSDLGFGLDLEAGDDESHRV